MALPPTIPTSFVPHVPGTPAQKFRSDLTGAFSFFAYGVLGFVFLLALSVFFYGRILAADQTAKDAALAKAEAGIDTATVEGFVRLRNRLNQSATLIKSHVAFSNFFTSLETLLPANVRFTALHLSLDSTGAAKVEGSGLAKSFNTLAVLSTSLATDGRIKDAIFSKISINKDNSVSFNLSAALDPKLIAFSPDTYALSNIQVSVPTQTSSAPATQTAPATPSGSPPVPTTL